MQMAVYFRTATRASFLTTQNTIPQQNTMVVSDGGHRSRTVLNYAAYISTSENPNFFVTLQRVFVPITEVNGSVWITISMGHID